MKSVTRMGANESGVMGFYNRDGTEGCFWKYLFSSRLGLR